MKSNIEVNRKKIAKQWKVLIRKEFEYSDKYKTFDLGVQEIDETFTSNNFDDLAYHYLLQSGSRSIYSIYEQLNHNAWISCAAYALAGELYDKNLGNYFKFKIANWYAAEVVPSYFTFFDHVAFHFYELSLRSIPLKESHVSFKKLTARKIRESSFNRI